jgi:hypothetical protein
VGLGGDDDELERLLEEILEEDLDEIAEDVGVEPPDGPHVPDGGDDDRHSDDDAPGHDAVFVEVPDVTGLVRPAARLNAHIAAAVKGLVFEGRALLRDAIQLASDAAGALVDSSISLITRTVGTDVHMETDVLFVQWTCASNLKGYRLSLDYQHGIKRVIPYRTPEETFENSTIHVARVPVVLNRTGERPLMPEWCLLVQHQQNAKLHSGPRAPSHTNVCVVCRCLERVVADDGGVDIAEAIPAWDNLLWRCYGCLTFWHVACCRAIDDDAELQLPLDGSAFACSFCVVHL